MRRGRSQGLSSFIGSAKVSSCWFGDLDRPRAYRCVWHGISHWLDIVYRDGSLHQLVCRSGEVVAPEPFSNRSVINFVKLKRWIELTHSMGAGGRRFNSSRLDQKSST